MINLVKMAKRSNLELVKTMAEFFNEQKRNTTRAKLTEELRINTETADMWLEIIKIIQNDCPQIGIEKIDRMSFIHVTKPSPMEALKKFQE